MPRPHQVYDFTAFSRRTPSAQPPGDRLDAQFSQHADAIAELQGKLDGLKADVAALAAPREPTLPDAALGPNAGGPYAGDAKGATSTAADYAQVSIDWAEYMPWTIPPNTLAVSNISGDHWSSRWWANKAAMFYQALIGAANPPLPASGHLPAISLYYVGIQGQKDFLLSTPDRFALSYVLHASSQVKVARNGARLMPDDGSGKGSYTVSIPGNGITLLWPAGADEVVTIDVWEPALAEAPLDGRIYGRQNGGWVPADGSGTGLRQGLWGEVEALWAALAGISKEPTLPNAALGPNAGGPYAGDDKGASATSADYAQVAIEWAEHLPDIIPPNILAINAISGDHWSSRWWANRAANLLSALGGANLAFVAEQITVTAANALAPLSNTPVDALTTMEVVVNGLAFAGCALTPAFHVVGKQIVWTSALYSIAIGDEVIARYRYGTSASNSMRGRAVSLYYVAAQGQTNFPLGTPDRFSLSYTLTGGSTVQASRNGVRLMPDDGTGKGGFVVSVNSVVLLWPAGQDETLIVDVWEPA